MQNNFTVQEKEFLIIKRIDEVQYNLEALKKQDINQKLNSIKRFIKDENEEN
jgi:hypothetical protein